MADPSPNSVHAPVQPSTPKRNMKNCRQCRQDRHKCIPVDRDWDGKQEKCLRCISLGHSCGPPEIKSRKRSQNAQLPSSSSNFDIAGNLHTHFPFAVSADSITSNSLSSPTASPSASASLDSSFLEDDVRSRHAGQTTQVSINNRPRKVTGRKHCEWEARKLLKDIGDMKALRKNILFDMEKPNELERRLGPSPSFHVHGSKLRAVLSAIDTQILGLFDDGIALEHKDMGSYKESFQLRLLSLMNDFRKPSRVSDMSLRHAQHAIGETVRLNQIIQNAVYRSHKKKQMCSEAEFICNALGEDSRFSRCPTLGPDCEANAAYNRAAMDLQHAFEQLTFDDEDHHVVSSCLNPSPAPLLRTYPAPQLAYRTCDTRMAIKLWNTSATSRREVDALHRSLLHYAVDSDDVQSVQYMIRTDPQVIKTTGEDIFGMSPLALAAGRNNTNMFNLLLRQGAPWFTFDTEGRSVLALAAYVGNIDIVRQMLTFRPYPPPLCMALYLAIEGQHEGPARLILGCFRDPLCYDEIILETAANLADRKELDGLATDIRNTKPFFGTASDAFRDVDEANFEDFNPQSNPNASIFQDVRLDADLTTLENTAHGPKDRHGLTPWQSIPDATTHVFANTQPHQW